MADRGLRREQISDVFNGLELSRFKRGLNRSRLAAGNVWVLPASGPGQPYSLSVPFGEVLTPSILNLVSIEAPRKVITLDGEDTRQTSEWEANWHTPVYLIFS